MTQRNAEDHDEHIAAGVMGNRTSSPITITCPPELAASIVASLWGQGVDGSMVKLVVVGGTVRSVSGSMKPHITNDDLDAESEASELDRDDLDSESAEVDGEVATLSGKVRELKAWPSDASTILPTDGLEEHRSNEMMDTVMDLPEPGQNPKFDPGQGQQQQWQAESSGQVAVNQEPDDPGQGQQQQWQAESSGQAVVNQESDDPGQGQQQQWQAESSGQAAFNQEPDWSYTWPGSRWPAQYATWWNGRVPGTMADMKASGASGVIARDDEVWYQSRSTTAKQQGQLESIDVAMAPTFQEQPRPLKLPRPPELTGTWVEQKQTYASYITKLVASQAA